MNNNFKFMTFASFQYHCFSDFMDVIKHIWEKETRESKVELNTQKQIISDYYNPKPGGILGKFTCWQSANYPDNFFLYLIMKMDGKLYVG